MLPKNRLGRQMIKKLHVVPGPEHPHQAQKPVELAVGERPAWAGLPAPAPKSAPAASFLCAWSAFFLAGSSTGLASFLGAAIVTPMS